MKRLFILLFAAASCYAAGGDTIAYSTDVMTLADGDTFYTDLHWASLRDTISEVVNGKLGNVNLASDAEIAISKLDTTGYLRVDSALVPSLRGLDVLSGNPVVDSLSGMDALSGNPVADSLSGGLYWDVQRLMVDTVGQSVVFDNNITCDTASVTVLDVTLYAFDSLTATKAEVDTLSTYEIKWKPSGTPPLDLFYMKYRPHTALNGLDTMIVGGDAFYVARFIYSPVAGSDIKRVEAYELMVGPSGSVIEQINMVDDTYDTLKIKSGGKTWEFLPIADK